jgi:hypothetical protein
MEAGCQTAAALQTAARMLLLLAQVLLPPQCWS